MQSIKTPLEGVLIIEPKVFGDERGFFFESFNQRVWEEQTALKTTFVQDNHSRSVKGVLRGLHIQTQNTQGKLVRVCQGEIFDVAVDLRMNSPTFKQWFGLHLSSQNKRQLWIPEGFAHGFLTLSDSAEVLYKATDYYAPQYELSIRYDDPSIMISWPLDDLKIVLSDKDANGIAFDVATSGLDFP